MKYLLVNNNIFPEKRNYNIFNNVRCLIFFLLLIFIFPGLYSQEIPDPMTPPRMVNDFAGFLSSGAIERLEQKLRKFNFETSTQIYIVTINDLSGYDISDFSTRLGEKWGVGDEKFDNGIVILIKPKTIDEKGEVDIAIGYGLEGAVPDIIANRIVDKEIIPYFKEEEHYEGLNQATNTLISITKGEYTAEEYYESTESSGGAYGIFGLFFIIFIFSIIGRSRQLGKRSVGKAIPFWILMSMLGSSNRMHRGSFGNFSSGSGGFGGFGGFSGGGGGSFGGGGAGGSW